MHVAQQYGSMELQLWKGDTEVQEVAGDNAPLSPEVKVVPYLVS